VPEFYNKDSVQAKQNPLIMEFVDLVTDTVGDGILSFSDTQSRPFMKFWSRLTISKYLKDKNEFKCVFFGTMLVNTFGRDLTKTTISDRGWGESESSLRQFHEDAFTKRKPIFLSSSLHFVNKNYQLMHQVKMPIKFGPDVDGTVGIIIFEPTSKPDSEI
jgi:hypothetical protein